MTDRYAILEHSRLYDPCVPYPRPRPGRESLAHRGRRTA